MNRKVLKYLYDIEIACDLIKSFSQDQTLADYLNNIMLRSAMERQFIIIGEALNQLIKLEPNLESKITDSRKIIDFRNLLVHAYQSVSDEVVWGIIEGKLPTLHQQIKNITNQYLEDGGFSGILE